MGFFRSMAERSGLGSVSTRHVSAGAETFREVGEGVLLGGALGVAHAMLPLGLDIDGKVPLDGVIAIAGAVGGVAMAHDESVGKTLRNVGAQAATLFTFRKAYSFAAAKKMANAKLPPDQRIPGDRIQEQNVALRRSNAAGQKSIASKIAGEFGFGSDSGAEDPVVAMSRYL